MAIDHAIYIKNVTEFSLEHVQQARAVPLFKRRYTYILCRFLYYDKYLSIVKYFRNNKLLRIAIKKAPKHCPALYWYLLQCRK